MKTGTYHHTEETKERIGESNRRRIIGEATRLKMSQSGRGKHNNRGVNNPCWKGGRKTRADGYILLRLYSNHPYCELANKSGYAMEHRVVMAEQLGRLLQPFPIEIVDHKNGIKDDNSFENLELKSQGIHCTSHNLERDYARKDNIPTDSG